MEFSVVESGYDRDEVEHCLADLGDQLARATAEAQAAAEVRAELELVRRDAERVHEMLRARPAVYRNTVRIQQMVALAEEEAAEIVAEAQAVLQEAKDEAERIRTEAYEEALRARRDFELALHARRRRERAADPVWAGVEVAPAPTAPNGGPDPAPPNGKRPNAGPAAEPAKPGNESPVAAAPMAEPVPVDASADPSADPPEDGDQPKDGDQGGSKWPRLRNRRTAAFR